ncbi:MAG: hypothetical protein GF383_01800 [Candidatus Lokiarchaeota archaeon]|nr:hypothetical protein [Candidatus Lokiarchaeota archaeon]MBD3338062.1 hypothetical protein [Candidatus Lokiarchaeota archaeon]
MEKQQTIKILSSIGAAFLIITGILEIYWSLDEDIRDISVYGIVFGSILICIGVIIILIALIPDEINLFVLLALGIIAFFVFIYAYIEILGLIGAILVIIAVVYGIFKKE